MLSGMKLIRNFIEKHKTFFKMQMFTLILLLILSSMTFFTINMKFQDQITENFQQACRLSANEVDMAVRLVFNNILESSYQVYNDSVINQFIKETGPLSYELSKDILNKATQIKNSSSFIKSVYVYSINSKQCVSTSYGILPVEEMPDQSFLKWFELIGNASIKLIDTHVVRVSKSDMSLSFDAISLFATIPLDSRHNIQGAIVINIDQSYLYQKLFKDQNISNLAQLYMLDDHNNMIISSDEGLLYKKVNMVGITDSQLSEATSKGSAMITVSGCTYFAVCGQVPNTSWKSMMLFDAQQFTQTGQNANHLLLILFLGFIIISILVFTWFFLYQTSPIDRAMNYISKVYQNDVNTKQILGSKVYDAVRSITDNNNKLIQELESVRPVLYERFIINLLNGVKYNEDEISARFKKYTNVDFSRNNVMVAIMLLENFDDYILERGLDSDIVTMSIMGMIKQESEKENLDVICVHTDASEIVLIICINDITVRDVYNLINSSRQNINEMWKMKISASICDCEYDVQNIRTAYKMAKRALRYKSFYNGETIYSSDLGEKPVSVYRYPFELEEQLMTAIRLNDTIQATGLLDGLIERIADQNTTAGQGLIIASIQLYNALIRLANELNISIETLEGNSNMLQAIFSAQGKRELKKLFILIIKAIMNELSMLRNDRSSQYYKNIVNYVNEHYMNSGLSLDSISEAVNLSPSYVNRILKKYGTQSFTQMICDVRIQHAREFIRQGKLMVSEISEYVGFSNPKYFISVFRKNMGLTPGQYKKSLNDKEKQEEN